MTPRKSKPAVAWGFFHGSVSRTLEIHEHRPLAVSQRTASAFLGLYPSVVFKITEPTTTKKGRGK